jgi:serine/threonine protein kinase
MPSDRFHVRRAVGRGANGVVYEAWDSEQSERVALKTFQRTAGAGPRAGHRELEVLARLRHPNVVAVKEIVRDPDGTTRAIAMEFVDGVDVVSHLRRGISSEDQPTLHNMNTPSPAIRVRAPDVPGLMPDFTLVTRAMLQLVDALDALHGVNLVHRDVKPGNTLVEMSGRLVLLDFDLVSAPGRIYRGAPGSLPYAAPEQLSGDFSPASDLYGAGAILFEVLVGAPPFVGTAQEIRAAKLDGPPAHPLRLVPSLSGRLADLAFDLMRLNPTERPTADEVWRRLGRQGGARGITSAPPANRTRRGRT